MNSTAKKRQLEKAARAQQQQTARAEAAQTRAYEAQEQQRAGTQAAKQRQLAKAAQVAQQGVKRTKANTKFAEAADRMERVGINTANERSMLDRKLEQSRAERAAAHAASQKALQQDAARVGAQAQRDFGAARETTGGAYSDALSRLIAQHERNSEIAKNLATDDWEKRHGGIAPEDATRTKAIRQAGEIARGDAQAIRTMLGGDAQAIVQQENARRGANQLAILNAMNDMAPGSGTRYFAEAPSHEGTNAADVAPYLFGMTAAGMAGAVGNIIKGADVTVGDALTGGKTSDEYRTLSEYLQETPEMERLVMRTSGLGVEGDVVVATISRATGIPEEHVRSYLRATEADRWTQEIENTHRISPALRESVGQWAYSIGQQLPGIALTAGAGAAGQALSKAVTLGLMGAQSYGGKLAENAKKYGFTVGGYSNALVTAAIETGTELIDDFVPTAGAILSIAAPKELGKNMLGEGFEEAIGYPLEQIADWLLLPHGEETLRDIFDMKEWIGSFASGAIVGGMMGSAGAMLNLAGRVMDGGISLQEAARKANEIASTLPGQYRPTLLNEWYGVSEADVQKFLGETAQAMQRYAEDMRAEAKQHPENMADGAQEAAADAQSGVDGAVNETAPGNGNAAQNAAGSAQEASALQIGTHGAEELTKLRASGSEIDTEAFSQYWQAGNKGIPSEALDAQYGSRIGEAERKLAYNAGAADAIAQRGKKGKRNGGKKNGKTQQQSGAQKAALDLNADRISLGRLGENGQKGLTSEYKGNVPFNRFYDEYMESYADGVNGAQQPTARQKGGVLTQAQRMAAFYAGQNDAKASLARETAAAKQAQAAAEPGLVQDDYTRTALTPEMNEKVDQVAKLLGLSVEFADEVTGGRDNASIQGGRVVIEKNNPNPLLTILGHETTHRLQELSPETYRAFREIAAQNVGEEVQAKLDVYRSHGEMLNYEQALDEAAADYAGQLMNDTGVLDAFIERNRGNRTLLERLRDAFRALKDKLTGAERKRAETAEGRLSAALDAAAKQARGLKGNEKAAQEGGVRSSIKKIGKYWYVQADRKVIHGDNPEKWGKQIENYINNQIRNGQDVMFPTTDGHVLALTERSAYKLSDRHRSAIEKEARALLSDKEFARKARVAGHIDELIQVARFKGYREDVNAAHKNDIGEDGFNSYLAFFRDNDGRYYRVRFTAGLNDTEETAYSIGGIKRRSLPAKSDGSSGISAGAHGAVEASPAPSIYTSDGESQPQSEISLAYQRALAEKQEKLEAKKSGNGRNAVKRSSIKEPLAQTDSTGRTLSAGQQEFFRDSKVTDRDGRLKVMYRGDSNDFTVFDREKSKYSNLYGRGFYFTDSEAHARQYGDAKEYYLNITAPVSTTETTITREQLRAFLEAVAENEDDFSFENYGYDATVDSVLDDVYGKSDFAMLYDVDQTAIGDMVAAVELFNEVNGTNFDGLILDTETVAFRSDQIKNVTNENPTGNPDIRFSIKEDTTAKRLKQLERENEQLRERVEELRKQTKRTKRDSTISQKSVQRAASGILAQYGANSADVEALSEELQSLYGGIARGELSMEQAQTQATELATQLIENALVRNSEGYSEYKDLLDYLRTTELRVPESVRKDIADYDTDLRKANTGRLKLKNAENTNIDAVYQELSEMHPEFFSEEREMNISDQLQRIAEVAGVIYDLTEVNPNASYMQEAVAATANDVLETFLTLPEMVAFANKQAWKLNEKHRERVQEILQQQRAKRADALKKLTEKYRAKTKEGREKQKAAQLRSRIQKHASALSARLLRPTDVKNVPEGLRTSVAALLKAIDMESGKPGMTRDESGKRVKAPEGTISARDTALRKLQQQYQTILEEAGDVTVDPDIQSMLEEVEKLSGTRLRDMNAQQLETVWKAVKAVEYSVVTAGKTLASEKYNTTKGWADALIDGVRTRKPKQARTRSHWSLDLEDPLTFFSHFGEAGIEIYRTLRNAQDLENDLHDRVIQEAQNVTDAKEVRELERKVETIQTERGAELKLTRAHLMELYLLSGREQARGHLLNGGVVQPEIRSEKVRRGTEAVTLTEGDLQSISNLLTKREREIADKLQRITNTTLSEMGNEASMRAYGYRKFTEKNYWRMRAAKEGVHQNVERGGDQPRQIKNIGFAKATTPGAKNALDIQSVFQTFSQHAADMVDYAAWLTPMEDMNRLYNYAYVAEDGKTRTGKTVKGVLNEYAGEGAGRYWMNLMEDIQNGIKGRSDSPMWEAVGRGIGNWKGAKVGANARVIIQQPTAYVRAAAILSPKNMAKGLVKGVTAGNGWKKALQNAAIARRKSTGGFDISNTYHMGERMFGQQSAAAKISEIAGKPAAAADAVTWGKIWNACEYQVQEDNPGVKPGSRQFTQLTAELFTDVIDATQVVDGVLQRANIMRSSNEVVKQATSFMGEPLKSLNLVMRTWDNFRYETDPKKRTAARKQMGRAVAALAATNVVNALAQSIIDAARDDDRDKDYWERFWAAFTGVSGDEENFWQALSGAVLDGNVGQNMNPAGQIPFVKDALSLLQGYDVSRTEMETVGDLIRAGQLAVKSIGGTGGKTAAYALKELLSSTAQVLGVPVGNLTRDMWAVARSIGNATGSIPVQYEMEKAIYNLSNSSNSARYTQLAFAALEQGDMESFKKIRADLISRMGKGGDSVDSSLRTLYKKRAAEDPEFRLSQEAEDAIGASGLIEKAQKQQAEEAEKTDGFEIGEMDSETYEAFSSARAEQFRGAAEVLENDPDYLAMDEQQQDDVMDAALRLAQERALSEASDGEYQVSTKWMAAASEAEAQGISVPEYVLFHVACEGFTTDRDADGKAIAGQERKDKVRAWLKKNTSLTEAQRAWLWGTLYKSEW